MSTLTWNVRKKSVYTKYEFWLSEVGQSNAEKMQVDTKGLYRYFLWLDNGEMRYSCKFYKKNNYKFKMGAFKVS